MKRSSPAAPASTRPAAVLLLVGVLVAPEYASGAVDPGIPASPPVRDGDRIRFGLVVADPSRLTVSFPARLLMTNGLVEYAVVTDYGKTHESLLVTDALPMDVQSALLLLRARPSGTNAMARASLPIPPGAGVVPTLHYANPQGLPVSVPFSHLFALTSGGARDTVTGALKPGPWLFNGSVMTAEGFGAHFDGSIVALIHDPIAILNNPGPDRDDDEVHVPALREFPPIGAEVRVELAVSPTSPSPPPPQAPPPPRR